MSALLTSKNSSQRVYNATGSSIPAFSLVVMSGYNSANDIPTVALPTALNGEVSMGITLESVSNNSVTEIICKGLVTVSSLPIGSAVKDIVFWDTITSQMTLTPTSYPIGWVSQVTPVLSLYVGLLSSSNVGVPSISNFIKNVPTWSETDVAPTPNAVEQRILGKISNTPAWTESGVAPSALSVENRFLKLGGGTLTGGLSQSSGFNTLRDTRINLGATVSLQTAGSQTLDMSTSTFFRKTGGTATITFSNMTEGESVNLVMESTGSAYTLTWAGETFRWSGASVPTPTATASRYDRYRFTKIGGVVYGEAFLNNG